MGRKSTRRKGICASVTQHQREIARGLKRIWYSKMGTPSSARIIEDVDLAFKSLDIFYRRNGAAVEGLADRNGHRCKEICEGKSVSWGGAKTKVVAYQQFFLMELIGYGFRSIISTVVL